MHLLFRPILCKRSGAHNPLRYHRRCRFPKYTSILILYEREWLGMIFAPMNYHYLHYPLIKFLNKVEKSPFNSVDLYCAGPQFNIYSYPLADLINLDKVIHARHLQVAVVTPENFSYPVNFCTLDRQTVEDSLRYYQRAIDTAVFLGCPKVQISIGSGYFDESSVRCGSAVGKI